MKKLIKHLENKLAYQTEMYKDKVNGKEPSVRKMAKYALSIGREDENK